MSIPFQDIPRAGAVMRRLARWSVNKQRGITGLETAIILIAFVVISGIFTYSALSAGLFSTQKSQAALYSNPGETLISLELGGGVMVTANDGTIQQISFVVANVPGGEPIDFTSPAANTTNNGLAAGNSQNLVIVNYHDENQTVNDLYWTVEKLGNADDDDLLEANERFKISVGSDTAGSDGGNLINALASNLTADKTFTLEVLTPAGTVLVIERTAPAYIDTEMKLS
jgi:flagellin FlaB